MSDGWTAWFRRRRDGPWEKGAEASSIGQARKRLDDFLRSIGVRLESNLDAVLTTGRIPDVPPRKAADSDERKD